jgi:hypothetical protein
VLRGITLIGIVTASIASWLIARVRAAGADVDADLRHDINTQHHKLTRSEALLLSLTENPPAHPNTVNTLLARRLADRDHVVTGGADRTSPRPS